MVSNGYNTSSPDGSTTVENPSTSTFASARARSFRCFRHTE